MRGLFAPLAMKVAGGIVAALLIAVAVLWWQNGNLREDLETARNATAAERAAHSITRGSVDRLEGVVREQNRAAAARAEEYRRGLAAAGKEQARLAGLAKASDARVARLLEIAQNPGTEACAVPVELHELLEGL